MAEPSVEEVRAQIDQILDRARGDEEFGNRLNSDPESTLHEAGLHGKAIGEVSQEIRAFGRGKSKGDVTVARPCDFTTCWISWCDKWTTFRTSS